jgi:hypothetical protein
MKRLAAMIALLLPLAANATEDQAVLNLAKAQIAVECSAYLHVTGEALPPEKQSDNMVSARMLLMAAAGWGADPDKFQDWGRRIIDLAADGESSEEWKEQQVICRVFLSDYAAEIAQVSAEFLEKSRE